MRGATRRASALRVVALLVLPTLALGLALVACNPSTSEALVPPRTLLDAGSLDGSSTPSEGGTCALACGTGNTCCGAGCTSTAWDPRNCGGCGIACETVRSTVVGACVAGGCLNLGRVGVQTFASRPAALVLSGSVLYADLPAQPTTPIAGVDLGVKMLPRDLQARPITLPIADGRGGLYYFEVGDTGHLLTRHHDFAANATTTLDDLGVGAQPHVLVRQGASVARVYSPQIGVIRTVCANGTVHDLAQSTGVAFGVADELAVYFGFGSPVTPAVRVGCEEGGVATSLPTTFGHVVAEDATTLYWFGVDRTMDASPVAGIFASAKDGATRARLITHPPAIDTQVTFPLLDGTTLYFAYAEHLADGTKVNVLASVQTNAGPSAKVSTLLASPEQIALDPAYAYTTAQPGAGGSADLAQGVYRVSLKTP